MLSRFFQRLRAAIRHLVYRAGYDLINLNSETYGYDPYHDIARLSRRLSREVRVFFDVGANVGQTCALVKHQFPTAQVFAFEPAPAAFVNLQEHVTHMKGVQAFNTALGSEEGDAELRVYGLSVLGSLLPDSQYAVRYDQVPQQTIRCAVTTLDRFCAEHGIDHLDVLKVDTEGFELGVLQGGCKLFSAGKIDFVYVEFNEILAPGKGSGGGLAPLCEFLRPYDFHFIASYTDWIATEGELFVVANALLARGHNKNG